jgi:RimJ/RimL family protein N-acetyltransferase
MVERRRKGAAVSARTSAPPLPTVDGWRAVELGADDVPRLQRFFDENPEYFLAVGGAPAGPGEAHEEIHGGLPPGWVYTRTWILGFVDDADALVGMANVVSDIIAPRIWHIGLMIVATRLHGRGVARPLYDAIERWAQDHGAQWIRLGVVVGNVRAERFWARCGFVEVRRREGVESGAQINAVRVMVKPLAGGGFDDYLALAARDRPESP